MKGKRELKEGAKSQGREEKRAMITSGDKPDSSTKRLLNVEEAAIFLGISPRTIYNAIAPHSKIPFPVKPKRIGKLVRFDVRDLEKYVDSL